VERVQDISEEDAKAEGLLWAKNRKPSKENYGAGFMAEWDSLNAKRGFSWDSNPWVWVIEFERRSTLNSASIKGIM
jgi:hypothetical protein